ncbi:protein hedgehog-like [Hydractinia symbiolongicarpus]|uniref:protein hedgehog-like n=1 Tax=Hydractinia symbiolongicarpus TaxID=13093 RepID=UPI00254B609B|nr:protein hedgehog-like [Hydractinia symbiolongicarpus]
MVYSTIVRQTVFLLTCTQVVLTCGPGRGVDKKFDNKYNVLERQPDVNEQSILASGPFLKALKPDDPLLESVYHTDIIFHNDLYKSPNRKAIKPCRLSLVKLANSLPRYFDKKYRLKVKEGYMAVPRKGKSEHNLHLEGRAFNIDLVSTGNADVLDKDVKIKNYRKLAGLAYYKAGFKFVHIREHHIHVSCRRNLDSPGNRESSHRCFPAKSYVRTHRDHIIPMKSVKVGDQLLTMGDNGRVKYSEVSMIMHRQHDVVVENYVKIETSNGHQIVLSPRHMVFTLEDGAIFAKDVHTNHTLNTYDDTKGRFVLSHVSKISLTTDLGAYAPLTMEGTVVVNDIYASCYAVFPSHSISHAAFYTWRKIYEYIKPLFIYVSSTTNLFGTESEEYHWYPHMLKSIVNKMYIVPYKM